MSGLPGKLIVFEGPDGVGKTTLSQKAHVLLTNRGLRSQWLSFPGREDGSLGRLVYNVHHQPEQYDVQSMTAAAKQTLHIAAHLDAIEQRIIPWLIQGIHVVMDRYWWSTWVYGTTAGLNPTLLQALIAAEKAAWGSIHPTTLFLIETNIPRNRESEDLTNWQTLKRSYQSLAQQEQVEHSIVLVPNVGMMEETMQQVSKSLESILT